MRDLRRGPGRTALGCLVLGTLVLTGCSAKQEANDTLPTASASPTAELPPLGPPDFPVPAEARTKDAAGAEAFLRYWIGLLNRQQAIPAGQPLRDLASADCYECLRIAKAFDDAAAAGWRYEGGQLSLNDVPEPQVYGDQADVVFGVRVEPLTVRDSSGSPVPEGIGELAPNAGSGLTLAWSEQNRAWSVAGMTIG